MRPICPLIILLSGTPGTGKTTLANHLSVNTGWNIFALGNYIIENKFYTTENSNNNMRTIDVKTASRKAAEKIHSQYMKDSVIVIDSHYADILVDGFLAMEEHSNQECISQYVKGENIVGIVLRSHPNILQERLKLRNYPTLKIVENLQAEILSESTHNMLEVLPKVQVFEIDTGINDVERIATEITNWYKERENYQKELMINVGNIDWIKILSENGTLDKYFEKDLGETNPIILGEDEE